MTNLLPEMSGAAWPLLAQIGAGIVLIGAVIALFGGVAAVVRNDRLALVLFGYTGGPLAFIGMVILLVGEGGWWVVGGLTVLAIFGWLIRPRKGQR